MPFQETDIRDTVECSLEKRNYVRSTPVSDLLSIFYFDSKANIFHTEDGRFGLIWRIEPADLSGLNAEGTRDISQWFSMALSNFPDGASGQYIRVSTRNIDNYNYIYSEAIEREWAQMREEVDSSKWWEPHLFAEDLSQAVCEKQTRASKAEKGFFQGVSDENIEKAAKGVLSELGENEDLQISFADNVQRELHEGTVPLRHEHYLVVMWTPSYIFGKFIENTKDRLLASLNLVDPNRVVAEAYHKHLKKLSKGIRPVQNILAKNGFQPSLVDGQGLVDLLYRILNPTRSRRIPAPKFCDRVPVTELLKGSELYSHEKVSENVAFSQVYTRENGWDIEDGDTTYYMRATSITGRIEDTSPGILQSALSAYEREGILTINFEQVDSMTANTRLAARQHWNGFKASLPGADEKAITMATDQIKGIRHDLNAPLAQNRKRLYDVSICAVSSGYDRLEVEETADSLESALLGHGHYERKRGDAMVHASLPFNFHPSQKSFIRRHQPYLSDAVADFCPLLVNFKGTKQVGVYFNNRSGTPVFVDLWGDQVRTGHSLVVGSTGTGKSFTFNYLLMGCVAKYNPKIWIIDKGRSYESLCNVLNGNYIELVTDVEHSGDNGAEIRPVCINPFYTPIDPLTGKRSTPSKEDKFFLVQLLSAMLAAPIAGDNTSTAVSGLEGTLLYTAIDNLYQDKAHEDPVKEIVFSDLIPYIEAIEYEGLKGRSVAEKLQLFYGRGAFAEIFDGTLDIDWDNDFTVLETARMATSPALGVVMLALFRQIDTYSKYKLPKFRKKIIAVDEAWAVLTNPNAAKALAGFFRELRKYNGACILISQTVTDFVKIVSAEESDGGGQDGIMENTSHYFLLPASDKDYKVAVSDLGFTEVEIGAWQSLASAPPFFGELFYRMRTNKDNYISGVLRLCSPSLCLWIGSSSPRDQNLRERRQMELMKSGLDASEARRKSLLELAKEYPYGVEYGKVA